MSYHCLQLASHLVKALPHFQMLVLHKIIWLCVHTMDHRQAFLIFISVWTTKAKWHPVFCKSILTLFHFEGPAPLSQCIPVHLCCFYLHHLVCTIMQLSLACSVAESPFESTLQRTGTRNGRLNKMAALTMSLERAFLLSFTVKMMGLHNTNRDYQSFQFV